MGRALFLRTSVVAGIAVVLAKVLFSCVDLASLGNGPPDAQAPPIIDGAAPDVVDPCSHVQPAVASAANDSTDELPTFIIALDTVIIDSKKVSPLDLDGYCTCDTRPGTPGDGGPSCASASVACDGDGGADNALGAVADTYASVVSIERIVNRLIASGHRTLLLQIQKYNGLANDSEVVVGTIVADGIRSQGCPSSVFDPVKQVWSAGRCGDDAWTLSLESVVPSGNPMPFVIGTGYVRDHQLVVRLNNAALLPFNDESTVRFRVPILTGHLVPLGEDLAPRDPARAPTEKEKRLFRIDDGLLAGRVLAQEALATLGSYLQSSGARLCTSPGFGFVHDGICGAADIPGQGNAPFDLSKSCDALSAALGFVAIPALAAYVSDAAVPLTGCEAVDAAAFMCP